MLPALAVPADAAKTTIPNRTSGQNKYEKMGSTINRKDAAPKEEITDPANVSHSVFARKIPSRTPAASTKTALVRY